MGDRPLIRARRVIAAVLALVQVLAVMAHREAFSQDQPVKDDVLEIEVQAVPQPFVATVGPTSRAVDQWVFGNATDVVGAKRQLQAQLAGLVREIDFACDLRIEQERKLDLAGRGDIKRFFEQVDDLWVRYQSVLAQFGEMHPLREEARELQLLFRHGFFEGRDSLLEKTARATLTPKQAADYVDLKVERRRLHYEAHLLALADQLQSRLRLSDEQHRKFMSLIRQRTEPPRRWGLSDNYVVLRQVAMIPRAELRQLFAVEQWDFVRRQLEEAEGMDAVLRQSGWLPVEGIQSR